jgi:Tol biopolymer transport system component
MIKKLCYVLFFITLPYFIFAKPITFDDLVKIKRLGDFSVSNDEKYIVFSLGNVLFEENRLNSDLYLLSLSDGNIAKLTETDKSESSPQWSNDNNYEYFISANSDPAQIFRINIKTLKTEKVTDFPLGVESFYLSNYFKTILFTTTIFES